MQIRLDITRRESAAEQSYLLSVMFESDDPAATVASALTEINADSGRRDINGRPFTPVRWECSCLQKKCGACAMVINGRPMLACDARLAELSRRGAVTVEPLKKFPPVADLIVDRSGMFEALESAGLWLENGGTVGSENTDLGFEASRCLQCGCCLEVCPNFYVGGEFFGMAAAVPNTRLLAAADDAAAGDLKASYRKHVYNGCGKSLACRSICPAGIDAERLLVSSNAAAVWKRRFGGRKKR